jgi:hypothetical protein
MRSWENHGYYSVHRKRRKISSRILSLKIWLPVFVLVVGLIYFAERGNPAEFYGSTPDYLKYALNFFAIFVSGLTGYRIFERCDINTHSDRGLFGMKLLAAGIGGIGLFLAGFGYLLYFEGWLIGNSLSRDTISLFSIFMGLALILVSGYVVFKFERRSGIIIYNR